MLRLADIVLVTKGDLVSQAEREVYRHPHPTDELQGRHPARQRAHGPGAAAIWPPSWPWPRAIESVTDMRLRFAMPGAVCSYCLSETRIGNRYQKGNVRKAAFGANPLRR